MPTFVEVEKSIPGKIQKLSLGLTLFKKITAILLKTRPSNIFVENKKMTLNSVFYESCIEILEVKLYEK